MKHKSILKATTTAAVLVVLGTAGYAPEKYSLKSPGGIAFSDFKGYEIGRWFPQPALMKCSRSSSAIRR
jgi:hypothetical protein